MASKWVKGKDLERLHDRITASIAARGGIISLATDAEDLLTSIIAWCFSPNSKGKELKWPIDKFLSRRARILKAFILNSWEFRKKIDLLPKLVESIDKECYKNNIKLIKEINIKLIKIGEFRNKLAHSPLNIWEPFEDSSVDDRDSDGGGFQIVEYKKGKLEIRTIGHDELEEEGSRAGVTLLKLYQLFALLRKCPEDADFFRRWSTLSNEQRRQYFADRGLRMSSS